VSENDDVTWEVMQPVAGKTIMRDFLDVHGEGIHHIAFDRHGMPRQQRLAEFSGQNFARTQSRLWQGKNEFRHRSSDNHVLRDLSHA
jgi:4-hydroxyphenylpyruvate dioxygenase-like putative hemolysin